MRAIHKCRHEEYALLKQKALAEAKRIARVLGVKFGAKEVTLYGSLSDRNKIFDGASDIDLAVSGLGHNYLKAYGHCLRLGRFDLDIKAYEDMPEKLRLNIMRKGRLLYARRKS